MEFWYDQYKWRYAQEEDSNMRADYADKLAERTFIIEQRAANNYWSTSVKTAAMQSLEKQTQIDWQKQQLKNIYASNTWTTTTLGDKIAEDEASEAKFTWTNDDAGVAAQLAFWKDQVAWR